MRMRVLVRLKSGVLDVQGKAVEHGLRDTGVGSGAVKNVGNVRIGKLIELDVDAANTAAARAQVQELCEKLLVNTVMETFEIQEVA